MSQQAKTSDQSQVQLHQLAGGASLFCSPQGNILFGCPPEILKRILASHLPMPDSVVVSENLHQFHSSQASLEFPLYHFLFVQRGIERHRRFQVVATGAQCKGLEELLRVTVVGPTAKEMEKFGTPKGVAKQLFQETVYLSLKNPQTANSYRIGEMINFFPLAAGEKTVLYPVQGKLAEISLERTGPDTFRVLYGEDAYDIDISVKKEQSPAYKISQKPFDRSADKFTITVLGRSNGFDPRDPANGYLLNIGGRVVLWDCPAYLHQHLSKLRLEPSQIEALVLSHVHEDHIDTSQSLRDPPYDLYTTPEIYFSLLVKLSAVFGCSMEEARKFHNWIPIDISQPAEIGGARFEFFHAVHAIPALGCRVHKEIDGKKGLLHISGDHLANEVLDEMAEAGGMTKGRREFFRGILTGEETLVLMDAGGGAIHGDYREYLDYPGRMAFMHTGLIQEKLPKGKELLRSGQVLNVLA